MHMLVAARRPPDRPAVAAALAALLPLFLAAQGCMTSEPENRGVGDPIGVADSALVRERTIQIGTRCQQEYQNGWQVDVGKNDVWNRCWNFQSTVQSVQRGAFYYNLHGAQVALEGPDTCGWPCGFADSVDFFYMNTHGGSNATSSWWNMWDQGSSASTSRMRLGSSGRQNMVFATFSCNTHTTDANTITRWYPVFAGGMVLTLGGHGSLYAGNTQSGIELANRLNNGEPIGNAWLESTWYADNRNTPTAIASGADANDCWNRMNGTTFDNLLGAPILRDGAIGYMCWSSWN